MDLSYVSWESLIYYSKFFVTIHGQCQLVKNVENRINGLNIGIKGHSGMNPETNGVVKAIC